jgi:hypothetical protein
MKSNEIYTAIYTAAINANEQALSEALKYGVIGVLQKRNTLIISPVCQLASENDQKATTFLLDKGASKDDAVLGYAIGGHTDQVNTLLENEVKTLLKNGASKNLLANGPSKNAAVRGYAIGGHTDQVNPLLDKGASKDEAVFGYAIGGHTDQVNKLLDKGASKDGAVMGYAIGGHADQVNTLLDKGASKDEAVFGYAIGGHTDQVNKLLDKGASKDGAVMGYGMGGHTDQVKFIDLFQKIYALEQHGKTLKDQGHPRKGGTAITLAKNIRTQVDLFLKKDSNTETISIALSNIITNGKKSMGEDRKVKDIIAHIVLALTGVGLLIIIGKKLATGSGFLNSTKRQKILSDIDKEVKNKVKLVLVQKIK